MKKVPFESGNVTVFSLLAWYSRSMKFLLVLSLFILSLQTWAQNPFHNYSSPELVPATENPTDALNFTKLWTIVGTHNLNSTSEKKKAPHLAGLKLLKV